MTVSLKITADKTKPRLNGYDHFWSVMMNYEMMDKSFTISDIYAFTGGGNPNLRTNISEFLRRLIKAGIVALVDEKNKAYRIVERQSATPKVRRDGTILDGVSKNQAMWNFMRTNVGAHGFTAQDIVAWASTDVTKISIETAKSYIAVLAKAGYLIEVIKGYLVPIATPPEDLVRATCILARYDLANTERVSPTKEMTEARAEVIKWLENVSKELVHLDITLASPAQANAVGSGPRISDRPRTVTAETLRGY